MALSGVETPSLCSASVTKENTDVPSESRNIDVPSEYTTIDVPSESTNIDVPSDSTKIDVPFEPSNIDVPSVSTNTNVLSGSTNTPVSPTLHSEIAGTVSLSHDQENSSPPSFDEDPEASPPTNRLRPVRDSLSRLVRGARRIIVGFVAYLTGAIIILLGGSAAVVWPAIKYAIAIGIPVAMIVIGSMYLGECPAEKLIPVYLIVGGTCSVLEISSIFQKNNSEENRCFHTIFNCFNFGWLIAGSIWTYNVYEPEYEDESSQFYCNKTLYLFTFWFLTISYILFGISILILAVYAIYAMCCGKN